jgi:hypothetical protein
MNRKNFLKSLLVLPAAVVAGAIAAKKVEAAPVPITTGTALDTYYMADDIHPTEETMRKTWELMEPHYDKYVEADCATFLPRSKGLRYNVDWKAVNTEPMVRVLEFWEQPSVQFPNGQHYYENDMGERWDASIPTCRGNA